MKQHTFTYKCMQNIIFIIKNYQENLIPFIIKKFVPIYNQILIIIKNVSYIHLLDNF